MLKKTITYTDYDGNVRTEDFWFHLTKVELAEMEAGAEGGMKKMFEKIISDKDGKRIMETFTNIILKSYGEKSADGRRFIKSEEMSTAFSQTEAYDELFMELVTNADAAAAFINGIIPSVPAGKGKPNITVT